MNDSSPGNAYIEHLRELNRIRVARHRMKKRNGGNEVMPSLQKLISTATKAVQAQVVDTARPQLARIIKEENGEVRRLVQHAVAKLEATEPWVMGADGRCIEKAAHATQDRARDYLTEINDRAGELPSAQGQVGGGGVAIHFHVHQPKHRQIPDVVVEHDRTIDITSEPNDSAP